VLVTSGTVTSAELLSRRLPPGALHQFAPIDAPSSIRRFLDHWRPDLAIFAESEIWPNTILELDRRSVPLFLVNGRLSERSFRRWSKAPLTAEALFARFAKCLAQSEADADRLLRLGARVALAGNLKFDSPPPPADAHRVAALAGTISSRPVWVAASTHPGEDEAVLAAHAAAVGRHPDLLTIIAPRHPGRGPAIAASAASAGLTAIRRSEGREPERGVGVYIADTMGELGLFYRLAPVVFVGGTLVPVGGHNPIEAAKLGAAVLHGPHTTNAVEVFAALDAAGGALPVADPASLGRIVGELLADQALVREMARAGVEAVRGLGGALDRTMAALDPFLPSASLPAKA
jgi:3-deoxy-D-manno-octulosonic-acid transferase